jgi:hypothetical protein
MMKIDVKQLENETQIAIKRADSNANPEWKREAEAAMSILIKQGRPFTADDIHRLLEHTNVKTHNNSALGAIFLRASRDRAD